MLQKILAVGLNPVMQKTIVLEHLWENEVNRSGNYLFSVAGKGANTARVLTELGARTIHLTHGGGLFRDTFASMLAEDGVQVHIVDSKSEIRLCYTLINQEHHTVTEIVEEAVHVCGETDSLLRDQYAELVKDVGIVTISGTKASGYSDDIIPWMVRTAAALGKKIVLDVRGDDLLNSLEYRPAVIKPNLKEFSETLFPKETFKEHATESSILDAVKERMLELEQTYGVTTVLTQGARSVFTCHGGTIDERRVDAVVPVNTIGCGDSFTAGLAYGISEGLPMEACVSMGIACGKANALNLKPGTVKGEHFPRFK
ncbi:MAG: PfkB family carbohydrate kinase [Sphaerochaeta sp.]|nr:PfkB family carbohydrate kinase [Sphaerochaeta sp.]